MIKWKLNWLRILPLFFLSLGGRAEDVLVLSDIHFDPLADRSLVAKLVEQPVTKWNDILAASAKKSLSAYKTDTNYALWQSTLSALKKESPNPTLVVIAGDFFRHTFRLDFEKAFKENKSRLDRFREVYAQFQTKTIQFLVRGLVEQFPSAQFVPVVGNNESTCGDYMVYLGDPFLKEFANAWQTASQHSIPSEMASDFATSGHYTTTFQSNARLRIIVGNDIFLTTEYNGRCGNSMVPPGSGELQWLDQQLAAAEKAKEKVWLITHVPPGVDVLRSLYNSVIKNDQKLVPMLKDDYNNKYIDILHRHARVIQFNLTGHNHFADFRLPGGEVAILIAPSISPDKTNNPAFQVWDLDSKNLKIKNLTQYSLNLAFADPKWSKLLDFDQAFGQSDVSLTSLKSITESLKVGKLSSAYVQYMTSDGGSLVKASMALALEGYICGITEMTTSAFETCAHKK